MESQSPLFLIDVHNLLHNSRNLFQKCLGSKVNLSTAYHSQTHGQAERTIQKLEDMFRACVIYFKGNWYDYLDLIEFS